MFIDSPDFTKRKVLLNAGTKSVGQPYLYGAEKQKLSRHVRQQLNEHNQDFDILQKFRKEAEDLKRQKYEAKRKQFSPSPQKKQVVDTQIKIRSLPVRQIQTNPQIDLTYSRKIQQPLFNTLQPQHAPELHQSPKIQETILHHYEHILKGKDKQLKRRQRKIDKSKIVIEKMNGKIKQLQQEKRLSQKQQQIELIKIGALVEEMNYKISQNRAAFKEELARMKLDIAESNYHFPNPEPISKSNLSFPSLPKKKKQIKHFDSERLIQGPSIFYDVPSESKLQLGSYQLDTKLQKFDKSLKNMKNSQFALYDHLQKYRDL